MSNTLSARVCAPSGKEEILKAHEAERYLNCSTSFLSQNRMKGKDAIPFIRLGRAIRYRKSDLDAFLEANRFGGAA